MKQLAIFLLVTVLFSNTAIIAQNQPKVMHALVEDTFNVIDVDFEHPVYSTNFESEAILEDWQLEGGWQANIIDGSLLLESKPSSGEMNRSNDHLVFWLKKEIPGNFLMEFKVRPVNKKEGLNIVFFNARGKNGKSIFDPSLSKRTGIFNQYIRGDINNYHISYWASDRQFSNMRKNKGFKLVASGKDYITQSQPYKFNKIQIYKRDNHILLAVDGIIALAFDDDGTTFGPAYTHSGWIGLRQMGHTQRCEYRRLAIYPIVENK